MTDAYGYWSSAPRIKWATGVNELVEVPEFAGYERGFDAGFKAAADLVETTLAGLYTAGWTGCDGTVGAARVKETVRAVLAARSGS